MSYSRRVTELRLIFLSVFGGIVKNIMIGFTIGVGLSIAIFISKEADKDLVSDKDLSTAASRNKDLLVRNELIGSSYDDLWVRSFPNISPEEAIEHLEYVEMQVDFLNLTYGMDERRYSDIKDTIRIYKKTINNI